MPGSPRQPQPPTAAPPVAAMACAAPDAQQRPGEREFVALFALLTSLTALSIDAVLPALPAMGAALAVADGRDLQLVVSALIAGMVLGELVFGPLSDAVGRRAPIIGGLVVFVVGTVLATAAGSMEQLLLGRAIQGVGVSGPKIASRALIRDRYEGEAMARIMSFIMVVFILVPMLAPAYGQLILALAGWRALLASFLVLAAIAGIWFALRQPETLPRERRIPLSLPTVVASTRAFLGHFHVMAYTVTAGLVFGSLLSYLSSAQAIFQEIYDTGPWFVLYFAILASGVGFASFVNGRVVMRLGMDVLTRAALLATIGLSLILLTLAFAHDGVPPLAAFMLCFFPIFFCTGIVFGNINALSMRYLGRIAGLGASLIGALSSLVAVGVAVGVGRLYDATVLPLAWGYLGCSTLGLVLVVLAGRRPGEPL